MVIILEFDIKIVLSFYHDNGIFIKLNFIKLQYMWL